MNFLDENPTEYALYAVPSSIRYTENVLGEEIPADEQTLNFVFAPQESYGADTQQNLDSMEFYEAVTGWIQAQNVLRRLPEIPGGTVKSVVPTLTAYPAAVGADTAKYQIQLRITYRRISP